MRCPADPYVPPGCQPATSHAPSTSSSWPLQSSVKYVRCLRQVSHDSATLCGRIFLRDVHQSRLRWRGCPLACRPICFAWLPMCPSHARLAWSGHLPVECTQAQGVNCALINLMPTAGGYISKASCRMSTSQVALQTQACVLPRRLRTASHGAQASC